MNFDRTHSTPVRRRLSLTVGSAAVVMLLCSAGLVALPSNASAASGWSPTATKALRLLRATPKGAASATRTLHLTVGLTPRNKSELNALIRQQSTPGSAHYGKYLTPAQFTADFAATKSSATAVSHYLSGQGLKHVTVAPNRLQISADATVGTAEKAFHTSITRFVQGGHAILANTKAAEVPTALAGKVSAVLGLSTMTMSAAPSLALPDLDGFYPKQFAKIYDAGSTKGGNDTTLAVIAEGNLAPTIKDLRLAETKQGLPQVPVSLVYSGVHSTDVSGADEWDLDTQTSTAVAPNTKRLYIYVSTSLTDSDLARSINEFASQDVAKSGSASLGECDALPYADGSMTVDDMAFAEAAAQGQTFFASSGDTGSACAVLPTNGVPGAGLPDVEYPASSPYVVAVGGTTLDATAAGDYQTEIAWNSGGGGVSPVETSPFWQSGVVPTAAAGLRGVPDVAFDADPNTGALIYVDGTAEAIGGTSLASPMALGLWTRIQSSHAGKLGFAAPKLYALYTTAQASSPLPPASVPGFHDIVTGVNGTYAATPGYDYTTGLGSWDVSALSAALK